MRRRTWLGLGAASALVLAAGGGAVALLSAPGLEDGKLSASSRRVFAGAARGLLDGTLAQDPPPASALLDRIDALVGNLPPHAQAELSQLLALLASAPGRRTFAGLAPDWPEASVTEIQQALQGMRLSQLALRRQAYHALHDIVGAAYFSEPATWAALAYPGPIAL
ncbi:hypothetical protein [Ramlibacter sp. PS4R-6]|uniref:hypothetical protein n=1 Tax=Ramlibacter sp. PS4R-6 TaxID=3133438 RepID=UPI00309E6E8F